MVDQLALAADKCSLPLFFPFLGQTAKAIGKMKVQLSANEPSSQVTIKMLDIEFENDMLMNASEFVVHVSSLSTTNYR